MANVAQLINTIHSLFIAYEDKFVATPNFHVFEMYAAHQGGQAVRTLFSAPSLSFKRSAPNPPPQAMAQMSPQQRARMQAEAQATATLWGLQGSASLNGKTAQTVNVIGAIKTTATAAEMETTGLVQQLYRAASASPRSRSRATSGRWTWRPHSVKTAARSRSPSSIPPARPAGCG